MSCGIYLSFAIQNILFLFSSYMYRLTSIVCYGLAVRIPGFRPDGPGSTPGMGTHFLSVQSSVFLFFLSSTIKVRRQRKIDGFWTKLIAIFQIVILRIPIINLTKHWWYSRSNFCPQKSPIFKFASAHSTMYW